MLIARFEALESQLAQVTKLLMGLSVHMVHHSGGESPRRSDPGAGSLAFCEGFSGHESG